MEYGAPHGIHGSDPVDDPGGPQGTQDFPQDHEAPQYVVHQEAHRPLLGHSGRDPILASEDGAVKWGY